MRRSRRHLLTMKHGRCLPWATRGFPLYTPAQGRKSMPIDDECCPRPAAPAGSARQPRRSGNCDSTTASCRAAWERGPTRPADGAWRGDALGRDVSICPWGKNRPGSQRARGTAASNDPSASMDTPPRHCQDQRDGCANRVRWGLMRLSKPWSDVAVRSGPDNRLASRRTRHEGKPGDAHRLPALAASARTGGKDPRQARAC